MKKELFAVFCVVTILAGTAPIYAANTTTTKTVVLTGNQTAKLTAVQTQLNDLITKIESLKKTYKNTTKNKGLLSALNQYEKQATKLNNAITSYLKHPTSHANIKIKNFQIKTKQLQWKVNVTEKVLKKTNIKKPVKPIKPVVPVHPVGPVKKPVHPVVPVHPVNNCTTNATK